MDSDANVPWWVCSECEEGSELNYSKSQRDEDYFQKKNYLFAESLARQLSAKLPLARRRRNDYFCLPSAECDSRQTLYREPDK